MARDCSWCDGAEEHTLVGGWDMEEGKESHRGRGSSLVENYTTSINQFYASFSLSLDFSLLPPPLCLLCLFHCSSLSPSWSCASSSFVHPLALASNKHSPWLPRRFFFLLHTVSGFVLCLCFISIVVCLHAFFIDLSFVAYQGFIPPSPSTGLYVQNLQIDLSPWNGLDIVCSWNKNKMPSGLQLILHFIWQHCDRIAALFFTVEFSSSNWKGTSVALISKGILIQAWSSQKYLWDKRELCRSL